jgi:hypothetical protein
MYNGKLHLNVMTLALILLLQKQKKNKHLNLVNFLSYIERTNKSIND